MVKKNRPVKREDVGSDAGISGSAQTGEVVALSEERYRTILEDMQDSYIEVDMAGNFTFINKATCRNLGYTSKELIGKNFKIIAPGDEELREVFAAYNEVYRTGEPHKGFAFKVLRKDGTTGYGETSISLLRNSQGRTIGFRSVGRDISERKQAEDALRESEEKYHVLFNNEIYAILIFDLETLKLLDVNDTYCRMYGYSREELLSGMTIHDITAEHQVSDAATQQAVNEGTIFIPLRYHRKKDGTVFPIEIVGGPYMWKGQKVMFALMHDITDRISSETESKKAEQALKESEEKYRAVVEMASDAIVIIQDGIIMFANPRVATMFGYETWEIEGMKIANFIPQANLELTLERYQKRMVGEKLPEIFETAFLHKSGEIIPVETNGSVIQYKGKPADLTIIRNITERKMAEQALANSNKQIRAVLDSLDSLIYIADFNSYEILFINKYGRDLWGDVQGKKCWNSIQKDQKGPCSFCTNDRLVSDTGISTGVYQWVFQNTVNGKWYECRDQAIPWIGKKLARMEIATDITDRKRMEEELQKVEKLESIGTLAGGIAHNFNNILTMILGNISLASMEAQDGSELQKSLEQAEKASLRAKDLTLQLLTFSKGGGPVKALGSLTYLLKDTTLSALGDSNVKCRFSIPDGLWQAEIDARQVSQVIYNLVLNARQSMPKGGTIELLAENVALSEKQRLGKGLPVKAGDYIRVTVTDHGSGIPKEHLEKIFDPFFTTKINAHGLGVPTSFSIARQHGGHLSVESELGTGSTFYFYLPASAPKQAKKKAIKAAGKARILVMDDEAGVRETTGRMLKHIGYEDVVFAADGAEAIKLYKAAMKSGHPFTVAVLDLTIPGGYGGEWTIRELLKIDPGVKAIISSGYVDDPVMAKYSDYGFSGVITKPYTIEELRKAVQDVMG